MALLKKLGIKLTGKPNKDKRKVKYPRAQYKEICADQIVVTIGAVTEAMTRPIEGTAPALAW